MILRQKIYQKFFIENHQVAQLVSIRGRATRLEGNPVLTVKLFLNAF